MSMSDQPLTDEPTGTEPEFPPDPYEEFWDPETMDASHAEYERLLADTDKIMESNLHAVVNMTPEQQQFLATYERPRVDNDSLIDLPEDYQTIPFQNNAEVLAPE